MKAAVKHWQSQWLEEIAALCLAESRAATEEHPKKYPWCSSSQLQVEAALLTWLLPGRPTCDAKTSRVPTQRITHPMSCQANGDILMSVARKCLPLTLRRMAPCYQNPCHRDSLSCRDREQFPPVGSKMKRMFQDVSLTVSCDPIIHFPAMVFCYKFI